MIHDLLFRKLQMKEYYQKIPFSSCLFKMETVLLGSVLQYTFLNRATTRMRTNESTQMDLKNFTMTPLKTNGLDST